MKTRIDLQTMLEEIADSESVYFQPPENIEIDYPCIIYSIKNVRNTYADDAIYGQDFYYELIVVDSDPDSEIFRKLCRIPKCKFVNSYISDNLNHFVFNMYGYF